VWSRSVTTMDVAAEAARRFLVTRQLLAPARSVEGGPDGVLEIFRRLGSIQFDPLSVAGRNHDLVLHARVAGYDPAWCDALYERRELFEVYNKGLSLYPHERLPMVPGKPHRASSPSTPTSPSMCPSGSAPWAHCPRSTSSVGAGRWSTGSAHPRTSVGRQLRPAPRRGLRGRDASRATRLPPLGQRRPARVGTAPQDGAPTVPHAAVGPGGAQYR